MNVSLSLNGLGEIPLVPIADLNGNKKYAVEEVECRNKLAALYDHRPFPLESFRLPGNDNEILINPLGMLYREITASSFAKISLDGRVIDPGSSPLGINQAGYILHSAIHGARRDVSCVLHLHTTAAAAVSAMKCGLLPIIQEAMILGPVAYHEYRGVLADVQEKKEIVKSLGDKKVLMLRNHGFASCCRNTHR
uniref:Aldolase_II domain-containing protein n=1 Tax=Globodera pallida TaxID=36090 RepID=A0A183BZW1_GLOPA